MRLGGFISALLAIALLVPETCLAAAAVEERAAPAKVQTTLRCATQYCVNKLNKVPTTIKTVRTSTKQTITKITYVKTRTVKDPKKTLTKTATVRPTQTVTQSTVFVYTTVWISTIRATRWFTAYSTTTVSVTGVTTLTRTPATKTIPTSSGFTAVLRDTANLPTPSARKRDALPEPLPEPEAEPEPEPEPVPAARYPKKVFCTKTLKTVVAVTTVKTVAKTTIYVPAKTTWKKVTKGSTVYTYYTPKNAPTITQTLNLIRTLGPKVTTTIWSTVTAYRSTVTVAAPTPTFYAGCAAINQNPPPGKHMNIDGGYSVYTSGGGPSIAFKTNGTVYDCCVACHTLPASQGTCLGSSWRFLQVWGEPPCWNVPDEDECEFVDSPDVAECTLFLASGNTCRTAGFDWSSAFDPIQMAVSNGPRCKFWKAIIRN
ncbi:hypothetical protein ABW19_dt0206952 [Dactylella cylindrospora]|nr:hypothetical protein ABW19_dt0206952 [Dactylella cylindrospora]